MGALGYLTVTAQISSHQKQLDDIQGRLVLAESRMGSLARIAATSYSFDTCPSTCISEITTLQEKVTMLEATTGTLTTTTGTLTTSLLNLQTSSTATCNKVRYCSYITTRTIHYLKHLYSHDNFECRFQLFHFNKN